MIAAVTACISLRSLAILQPHSNPYNADNMNAAVNACTSISLRSSAFLQPHNMQTNKVNAALNACISLALNTCNYKPHECMLNIKYDILSSLTDEG
jgi:hypothetical protein